MYEQFEHAADLGLRVQADDLNSLFAEAGRALFSVIVRNLDDVRTVQQVEFKIEGKQTEYLLVDWLGELLFAFESRCLLLRDFSVNINDGGLTATARGESFDESRHELEHEVKAITYHGLKVEQTDGSWAAEVIVDV